MRNARALTFVLFCALAPSIARHAGAAPSPKTNTLNISPSEPVRIKLSDGLALFGEYREPKKKSAPVLMMLHGLGSSHGEWRSLAEAASRRGWGSIGIDLRGHGESQRKGAETVYYKNPQHAQDAKFWQGMIGDTVEAAKWLENNKGIEPTRLVLVGASVGANISLSAAVAMRKIPSIVLLSPGYVYAGISTVPAMKQWRGPALLIASRPDAYAAQSVKLLQEASPAKDKLTIWISDRAGPQGAHGVQLFDGKMEEQVLDWINKAYAH